jgi:hypothetical protein
MKKPRTLKSAFSYYGGKSKLAHRYPAPTEDLIIEPFAGAASYALLHGAERDVWINDLDPITYSIWQFLTSDDALDWVKQYVPVTVALGARVSEMLPADAPAGMHALLRAEANHGTQGSRGVRDVVTGLGQKGWTRLHDRMDWVIPRVAHWHVTNTDYAEILDMTATWFIDPPYDNAAGLAYRTPFVSFDALADWTVNRSGQVIVCENAGATWLPFEPLTNTRLGVKSRYQTSNVGEVIWHRATDDIMVAAA